MATLPKKKEKVMHNTLRSTLRALLTATVLSGAVGLTTQANATQSFTGEGGLPLNPTANGIAPGTVEGQANYTDMGDEDGASGDTQKEEEPPPQGDINALLLPKNNPLENYDFQYYGALAAGRIADNWEVSGGITRLRVRGDGPYNRLTKTGVNLGVKYLVNPEAPVGEIHWAVGAGYDRALLKNWRAYGVASKGFNVKEGRAPIMGHLGVRWDRYSLDDLGGFDGETSSKVSVYAGTEIPVTRSGDFKLTGEIASKNNEFEQARIPFSVGGLWEPGSSPFSVAAGLQRQGLIGDTGWYAKVGYSFR
jgi:hypothetical protein